MLLAIQCHTDKFKSKMPGACIAEMTREETVPGMSAVKRSKHAENTEQSYGSKHWHVMCEISYCINK